MSSGLNRTTQGIALDYTYDASAVDFSGAPKNPLAGQVYHHPIEMSMYIFDKNLGWIEAIKEYKLKDAARKYGVNIGDGNSNTIMVTHNLGTPDLTISIKDLSTQLFVYNVLIKTYDVNTLIVAFQSTPTINQYRITVIG